MSFLKSSPERKSGSRALSETNFFQSAWSETFLKRSTQNVTWPGVRPGGATTDRTL
jgi:hypothetical protein